MGVALSSYGYIPRVYLIRILRKESSDMYT
jgi:hypothetical protein